MDLIKEENERATSACCVNCLNKNNEINTLQYKLQSDSLKTIFKIDVLFLCYICTKMVQNAECLIETILSNQILLNLHNFSDETKEDLIQPICRFSLSLLDPIELSGIDEQTPVPTIVYKHGAYKECVIKDELKCEIEDYMDNDDNDFIDIQIDVKDEVNLLELNAEYETNLNQMNTMKKNVKKKKGRKKCRKIIDTIDANGQFQERDFLIENDVNYLIEATDADLLHELKTKKSHKKPRMERDFENSSIEKMYITREQCMEERANKAQEKAYVDAPYKCKDCIKGFTFKASYHKHLELHSKEKGDYECDICKQRMDTEDKMLRHKKYHEVRFKCLICGLIRSTNISDHYNTAHSKMAEIYVCKDCPKSFTSRLTLRKHATYAHRTDKRVTCAHCMKTYANKDVLRTHIHTRHPKELPVSEVKKTCVCNECGKAFRAPSHLKAHSLKHSSEKRFYCVECNKSFKCENGLKQHLKLTARHVNPNELRLACTHCDKKFGIRRDLERHMNRIHLNVRPFKCDRCERAFVNSWCLNKHKKLAHEGYKRPLVYPCPMCDRLFDRNTILKSHIRTHTGERPYQCTRCPARFSQSSSLGTHTKLVHLKQTRDGKPKTSSK